MGGVQYWEEIVVAMLRSTHSYYAEILLMKEDYTNYFVSHWQKSKDTGQVLGLPTLSDHLNEGAILWKTQS